MAKGNNKGPKAPTGHKNKYDDKKGQTKDKNANADGGKKKGGKKK